MRLLFELDTKDYDPNGIAFVRHSARCIHIKNGLVAMVHSIKYDYYKLWLSLLLSRAGAGYRQGQPFH